MTNYTLVRIHLIVVCSILAWHVYKFEPKNYVMWLFPLVWIAMQCCSLAITRKDLTSIPKTDRADL